MSALFDLGARTRTTARKRNEALYTFLNTSAWPSVSRLREFWDSWFSLLDETKKNDLAPRFSSRDHHTHMSAFLEMFSFACLRHSGYEVATEPAVGLKKLDFLASGNSFSFYAECTVTGQSSAEAGAEARQQDLLSAIDEMDSGRFLINPQFLRRGPRAVPARRLCAELRAWLESLDHGAALKKLVEAGRLSEWSWKKDGWIIHFTAFPLNDTESGDCRGALGIVAPPAYWMKESLRLRGAIEEKATKYGRLDAPLLLILDSTEYQQEEDLIRALVGDETWSVDGLTGATSRRFHPNGVFGSRLSHRNVFLSAVMHGRLNIFNFASRERRLFLIHHPFASRRLPRGLFPFCSECHFDDATLQMSQTPATVTVGEFFGLPPGRPFFDEDSR